LVLVGVTAHAFDLNLAYRDGYIGSGTDSLGNVVTMGTVTKMDSSDPALASLANIITWSDPLNTLIMGNEIGGTIDMDSLVPAYYGHDSYYFNIGTSKSLRLNTADDLTNVRWVWLSARVSPSNAYPYFAGDRFYHLESSQEVYARRSSPSDDFDYRDSSNLGFGYLNTEIGTTITAYDYQILVETIGNDIIFRGGVKYDYSVQVNAVPEPATLLGMALPALFLLRKRRA